MLALWRCLGAKDPGSMFVDGFGKILFFTPFFWRKIVNFFLNGFSVFKNKLPV
jgi:hypothetical protein